VHFEAQNDYKTLSTTFDNHHNKLIPVLAQIGRTKYRIQRSAKIPVDVRVSHHGVKKTAQHNKNGISVFFLSR